MTIDLQATVLRFVELLDHLPRIVTLVRLTPSRRARAAEEGWPIAFMRKVDWGVSGGNLTARLGLPAACGCSLFGTEVVLYDIDCAEHDVFGSDG
jgi:hypothetical protein